MAFVRFYLVAELVGKERVESILLLAWLDLANYRSTFGIYFDEFFSVWGGICLFRVFPHLLLSCKASIKHPSLLLRSQVELPSARRCCLRFSLPSFRPDSLLFFYFSISLYSLKCLQIEDHLHFKLRRSFPTPQHLILTLSTSGCGVR